MCAEDIEPQILKYDQDYVLHRLQEGAMDLCISDRMPVDEIIRFGLEGGWLQKGLSTFPDPRKSFEVPLDILLLPQIIQRLNDEHSLLTAPYMLNSADLLVRLGYSANILGNGFNNKNKSPREAPFHGETLKHVLLSMRPIQIIDWFNNEWNPIYKKEAPGRSHIYIVDGMKIHVPPHRVKDYEGAGTVQDDSDNMECGYKVVWIMELIDRKGVILSMKMGPIERHDLPLAKELLTDFNFETGSYLLMDRGFIDLDWIAKLKEEKKVDVVIPLRNNSDITQYALADNKGKDWQEHPKRKGQQFRELTAEELKWKDYAVFESGVFCKFIKKDGVEDGVAFVTTRFGLAPEKILELYDLRSKIEVAHRELKCFQGMEKLLSTRYTNVVFRVVMGVLGFNLFNLFLNAEKCNDLKEYTLKLLRQKRRVRTGAEFIMHCDGRYGIFGINFFLDMLLKLPKEIQKKLQLELRKHNSS